MLNSDRQLNLSCFACLSRGRTNLDVMHGWVLGADSNSLAGVATSQLSIYLGISDKNPKTSEFIWVQACLWVEGYLHFPRV